MVGSILKNVLNIVIVDIEFFWFQFCKKYAYFLVNFSGYMSLWAQEFGHGSLSTGNREQQGTKQYLFTNLSTI